LVAKIQFEEPRRRY